MSASKVRRVLSSFYSQQKGKVNNEKQVIKKEIKEKQATRNVWADLNQDALSSILSFLNPIELINEEGAMFVNKWWCQISKLPQSKCPNIQCDVSCIEELAPVLEDEKGNCAIAVPKRLKYLFILDRERPYTRSLTLTGDFWIQPPKDTLFPKKTSLFPKQVEDYNTAQSLKQAFMKLERLNLLHRFFHQVSNMYLQIVSPERLVSLTYINVMLQESDIKAISNLVSLTHLDLSGCWSFPNRQTLESFQHFTKLTRLQTYYCSIGFVSKSPMLQHICKSSLKTLILSDSTKYTLHDILIHTELLNDFSHLTRLSLQNMHFSLKDLEKLVLPNLTSLDMDRNRNIKVQPETFLPSSFQGFPRLQHLQVGKLPPLNNPVNFGSILALLTSQLLTLTISLDAFETYKDVDDFFEGFHCHAHITLKQLTITNVSCYHTINQAMQLKVQKLRICCKIDQDLHYCSILHNKQKEKENASLSIQEFELSLAKSIPADLLERLDVLRNLKAIHLSDCELLPRESFQCLVDKTKFSHLNSFSWVGRSNPLQQQMLRKLKCDLSENGIRWQ